MGLFEELLESDRKLELEYEYARADQTENAKGIRAVAAAYLESYATFHNLSNAAVLASYRAMVRHYVSDIRAFVKTGKYPLEINNEEIMPSRTDYDLFLILTILMTRHRCSLMQDLTNFPVEGKGLVIGVGSGVELNFIGAPDGGEAYDLCVSAFAQAAFSGWQFREALYRPTEKHYDSIYAIELLEHLEQPYVFLAECCKSLSPGGKLVVTTATNVPQFDHRFNFVSDEGLRDVRWSLGLLLSRKHVIPHAYPQMEIGARNVFYVFKKVPHYPCKNPRLPA